MKTVLFQGDSITDVGRSFTNDGSRGGGYPTLVAATLGFKYPDEYNFLNRGISGNRIVDLYQRINADIINLKPDYMSILIGVNDVWHEFISKNGVSADKYEKIYTRMIEEVKEALPDIKIMILEPFTLRGSGNEAYWDDFNKEVRETAKRAKKVADNFSLPFIKLQDKFDELAKKAPNSCWLSDGVHPTAFGHKLIENEWIKAFEKM